MKSLIGKLLVGTLGLTIAFAPLAANAADRHGHDRNGRGGYHDRDNGYRGGDRRFDHGYQRRYDRGHVVYERGPRYNNGFFGPSPYGFNGYFWNGDWYHNRQLRGGIFIYF